jgi:hypothetical protein
VVQLAIVRRDGDDPTDAEALDSEDLEYDEADEKEIDEAFVAAGRLLSRGQAYAGFADRPASAVIAQVCAELGLTPDWRLWAKEAWALEEADTLPGSPFAGLAADRIGRQTGPP